MSERYHAGANGLKALQAMKVRSNTVNRGIFTGRVGFTADIAWKVDLNDQWSIDGIASYSRGERTDVSDYIYRLAPFNGSIGLTHATETWSIKPEVVLYSKQDKVSAYNTEQETPGYEIVNVAFGWDPLETLRVEARINNLLDETYQDHLVGINRAMGSGIPVGERLYGAERTISAGVIFSF